MSIYMKVDGIEGSVTAKGFEKWIELNSFQFATSRSISMETGNSANRNHGRPSISEIVVTKSMEQSSFGLLQDALRGDKGKKVTIKIVEVAQDKYREYVSYELEDTLLSSYSVSTGGGVPSETVTLSYAKITTSFTSSDKNNKSGQPARVVYDIAQGVAG
jgi:type VI secretion system secreted protein Hcp